MVNDNKFQKFNLVLNILIIILLIAIIVLFITKNNNSNIEIKNNKPKEEKNIVENLIGEWGMCISDMNCYGMIIKKEGNDYSFNSYQMWSEGNGPGIIKKSTKITDDEYKLEIYFPAYEDEISSSEEYTGNYLLDISKISNNIIKFNNYEYQKVIGDREDFFRSLNKQF